MGSEGGAEGGREFGNDITVGAPVDLTSASLDGEWLGPICSVAINWETRLMVFLNSPILLEASERCPSTHFCDADWAVFAILHPR